MSKFLVDLYVDGYETEEERDAACEDFIYEQLDCTASSVKVQKLNPNREAAIEKMAEALGTFASLTYIGNGLSEMAEQALEAWRKANEDT